MPIYQCPVEGFEEDFVEMSDQWTRAEIKAFGNSSGEEYINLIRSKIVSVRLRTTNGTIDKPEKFTEKSLDAMLWPNFSWLMTLPQRTVGDILDLGESLRRSSLQRTETTQE